MRRNPVRSPSSNYKVNINNNENNSTNTNNSRKRNISKISLIIVIILIIGVLYILFPNHVYSQEKMENQKSYIKQVLKSSSVNSIVTPNIPLKMDGKKVEKKKELFSNDVLQRSWRATFSDGSFLSNANNNNLNNNNNNNNQYKKEIVSDVIKPLNSIKSNEVKRSSINTKKISVRKQNPIKQLKMTIANIGGTQIQSLEPFPINTDVWKSTIFISIASYRDSECTAGIWSALAQAGNPNRIHIGIMQQHEDEDGDCLSFAHTVCLKFTNEIKAYAKLSIEERLSAERLKLRRKRNIILPFSTFGYRRNSSMTSLEEILAVCTAVSKQQIKIKRVNSTQAKGPTYGRHHAQNMLKDEDYFLQVDVHSIFVAGWDTELIRTWMSTKNVRAVITTYPRDLVNMKEWLLEFPPFRNRTKAILDDYVIQRKPLYGHQPEVAPYDPIEIFLPKVVPVLCHAGFVDNQTGMVKLESAVEIANPMEAVQVPFWAGGLCFGPAHLVKDAPYDPYTPYLFDGEEFSMAARLWTHGYDFYAPYTDIVYHPYAPPKKKPRYWEIDWAKRYPIKIESERRIRVVLGLDPNGKYDRTELEKYSVGKWRTLNEYYEHACIDLRKQKSYNFWEVIQNKKFPLTSCPPWPTDPPKPTSKPTLKPKPTKNNLESFVVDAGSNMLSNSVNIDKSDKLSKHNSKRKTQKKPIISNTRPPRPDPPATIKSDFQFYSTSNRMYADQSRKRQSSTLPLTEYEKRKLNLASSTKKNVLSSKHTDNIRSFHENKIVNNKWKARSEKLNNQHLSTLNQPFNSNQQVNLNQQQVNPNQQQVNPNQQQVNLNQQQVNPNQQQVNLNQQQVNPNQQQVNPNQQQVNPNQQQVNPNQQQFNPNQQLVKPNKQQLNMQSNTNQQVKNNNFGLSSISKNVVKKTETLSNKNVVTNRDKVSSMKNEDIYRINKLQNEGKINNIDMMNGNNLPITSGILNDVNDLVDQDNFDYNDDDDDDESDDDF